MSKNIFKCSTCSAMFLSKGAFETHLTKSNHRKPAGRGRGGRAGRGRGGRTSRGRGGTKTGVLIPSTGLPITLGGRGRGSGNVMTVARSVVTRSIVTVSSEHKTRKAFYCSLLVDKSGSMAGSKLREALNGVEKLLKVLRPKDLVTFRAFNHQVDTAFVGVKSHKIDMNKMRAKTKSGGMTALFDSVKSGAEDFKESTFQPLMILLTDGQDTSSTCSAADARSALLSAARKHKGFRAVLLSVGNEGLQQLQQISKGIRGVHVHSVAQSANGVKKAFQWATTHVTKIIRQEQHSMISQIGHKHAKAPPRRKIKFLTR